MTGLRLCLVPERPRRHVLRSAVSQSCRARVHQPAAETPGRVGRSCQLRRTDIPRRTRGRRRSKLSKLLSRPRARRTGGRELFERCSKAFPLDATTHRKQIAQQLHQPVGSSCVRVHFAHQVPSSFCFSSSLLLLHGWVMGSVGACRHTLAHARAVLLEPEPEPEQREMEDRLRVVGVMSAVSATSS